MAEGTLLQHMSVLGVSFANTSDFSMKSISTWLDFRQIKPGSVINLPRCTMNPANNIYCLLNNHVNIELISYPGAVLQAKVYGMSRDVKEKASFWTSGGGFRSS